MLVSRCKVLCGAAFVLSLVAISGTPAAAVSLSLMGAPAKVESLPDNYNPSGAIGRNEVVARSGSDEISVFEAATDGGNIGGGLWADDSYSVSYSFLGYEAGAVNYLEADKLSFAQSFSNRTVEGDSISTFGGSGYLDFGFLTTGLDAIHHSAPEATITNGGTSSYSGLKLGFSQIFNEGKSVLVFFGDGRGDSDFDDLVMQVDITGISGAGTPEDLEVPHAPIPAAGFLLIGGLGALAGARRLAKRRS